ncbi:tetratricopeptide repeat protein [Candidatus Omnitrophota bacterium]
MIKINFRLILILLVVLSIAGCSEEYNSERYLYKAANLSKDIVAAPEIIPPYEFDKAIEAYRLVFEKYPDTFSARRARVSMGTLYLFKKDYATAREILNKALELYPEDRNISIDARFTIAKSYEKEGLWDKAFVEYKRIVNAYPKSGIALTLPTHIVNHYNKTGNIIERNIACDTAIRYYSSIAKENPKSKLGFRAESFMATCYIKNEDWSEAVGSLEKLVMHYPTVNTVGLSLRMIGDISVKRLNDSKKAIDIFNRFLKRYPDHVFKEGLEKWLEVLSNV